MMTKSSDDVSANSSAPVLENWPNPTNYFRTRDLPDRLTVDDIRRALPGIDEKPISGDEKAAHIFYFIADGEKCAIWRWKGKSWTACGPKEIFAKLGLL